MCLASILTKYGMTTGLLAISTATLVCLRAESRFHGSLTLVVERYNYTAAFAFDYSSFPVSRFVNEFGYVD